jgi:hypothetical protein
VCLRLAADRAEIVGRVTLSQAAVTMTSLALGAPVRHSWSATPVVQSATVEGITAGDVPFV